MIIKTDSYETGQYINWNMDYINKVYTNRINDLKVLLRENGIGPFIVMNEYTVIVDGDRTRWVSLKSTNVNEPYNLNKIDEKYFAPL